MGRAALREAHERGARNAARVASDPTLGPKLLAGFGATTRREIALRRALLAVRVPPSLLPPLRSLVPGPGPKGAWPEFVEQLAFWRGVRRGLTRDQWVRLTHGVPVLLYHAFDDSGDGSRYVVTRRAFARQMRLLAWLRYRVIGFDDLARAIRDGTLPPRRAVAITIDDGYTDNLTVAYPILRRRRFPATIYLVSSKLGGTMDWGSEATLAGRPLLSAEEIGRLRDDPYVRFGAHTRTHCELPEISDEEVHAEISGSREDLARLLNRPADTFAYPYGAHDDRAAAAVLTAGFVGAGTTKPRLARPDDAPARIPRIEIFGSDSLPRFLTKLWFGMV
jgi:peptidoglycan/xylan/chitin deacetylase (PgdA/CDA1 family)